MRQNDILYLNMKHFNVNLGQYGSIESIYKNYLVAGAGEIAWR